MDNPDRITTIFLYEKKADERVIVAGTGSALDEGIKNLLMGEPELKVLTATYGDTATFLKEVAQASPDVIVVSEAGSLDWNRTSELLHGLLPKKTLRVIVIRMDDNILEVYDKQCLKITNIEGFMTLIRHY